MLCFLYRWRISGTFDNNSQLPPGCRRHLMRCDRCRTFFTSSLTLGERLSLEAAMAQPAVPARLGDQVTAMIGCSAGVSTRRPFKHWPMVAAACAAAILMPVVFMAVAYMPTARIWHGKPPTAAAQPLLRTDFSDLTPFAESVGGLLERPLAVEVETLQKQTKSVVEFLMSCSGADLATRRQAL